LPPQASDADREAAAADAAPRKSHMRVLHVIAGADLARRLVENGTRTYEAHFTKQSFVRTTLALYQRMVEAAGA
jgi:hypothetical protein